MKKSVLSAVVSVGLLCQIGGVTLAMDHHQGRPAEGLSQDFHMAGAKSFKGTVSSRLSALRVEMEKRGLQGFYIPMSDEYLSEYTAPYAKRLAYVSGFTGSAGTVIVLKDKAAIFADSRYTIQARRQVDPTLFEIIASAETSPLEWLGENVSEGESIGFDPTLFSFDGAEGIREVVEGEGGKLVGQDTNPVDAIWSDQPGEPNTPLFIHDIKYAGKSSHDKRMELAEIIKENEADGAVFSALDSIAWLFNIRANDVLNTPLTLAFALLDKGGNASLFLDPSKVTDEIRAHLGDEVKIENKDSFLSALEALGASKKAYLIDPGSSSFAIFNAFEGAGGEVLRERDLAQLPKSIKNEVEIKGFHEAVVRDGVSLTKFLHWFSVEAPKGGLDEIKAAEKLTWFRAQDKHLYDLSFDAISAVDENAALPHYAVSEETNLPVLPNSIYLIDSGGQYLNGTTDVTRTVAVGTPTAEQKKSYTLVLKGHIAVATAKLPHGQTGRALDAYARRYLWDHGLSYGHGTGHGIGNYLSVHEGPHSISSRAGNIVPLEPGMIFSNEPGYYKEGEFGIRIESLVLVKDLGKIGDNEMIGFEHMTWVPMDRNLIDKSIMSEEEINWVNDYHAQTFDKLNVFFEGEALAWLRKATSPL